MSFDDAPLILTLMLDDASQAFFDRARERWYPANLNFIRAHVTLFHHLPGERLFQVSDCLAMACAKQGSAAVAVTSLRPLGRGVAYNVHAPEIEVLRARLATQWQGDLTAQDRQGWRPHVTVQNKVSPAEARALQARLSREFIPFHATARGLSLWRYRGGPWEQVAVMLFAG